MIKYILIGIAAIAVMACSHKKIVGKDCEKTTNPNVWICDPIED